MKTLVFLLVLANLLFYAFSAGYFGRPDNPDAARVEKQVLPERMRIVSRGEAPASSVKAAEPAKPEVVAEAPKAEPATKEPAAICLVWEHLPPVDAERVASLLSSKFAEFKVSRRLVVGEGNGWGVFVPPLAGKADAERKATELRQLGVTDYFIVQDGPIRHAISLGIFSSEKGAQERLAELKEKGVRSARVMPRPGKDSTVNVQATGPASAKDVLLAAIGKLVPAAGGVSCK